MMLADNEMDESEIPSGAPREGVDEDPGYFDWPSSSTVAATSAVPEFEIEVHNTVEPITLDTGRTESPVVDVEEGEFPVFSPDDLDTRPNSPAVLTSPWPPELDLNSAAIQDKFEQPPHARARFPSDADQLFKTYSARPGTIPGGDDGDEADKEPATHRGRAWHTFRSWIVGWKEDLGWPEKQQDTQDFIGDTGIDLDIIRKSRKPGKSKGAKKSSKVKATESDEKASTNVVRPGLGFRSDSSSTVQTLTNTTVSAPGSGTATPGTLRRIFGAGVDPYELRGALRKLKSKIAQKDSSQTKYLQAKAELAHRRNLVLSMVYAFMAYGAPPYRLEEYILQLFKVLEMDGRVNYTVGCMEISFINPIDPADPMTRSAYTTLVKAQGLDVGACEIAFHIYKDVVAGDITIEEATQKLNDLKPTQYPPWLIVPLYGVASALTCVWAFGGFWTDMPVAFVLGCLVGILQNVVAVKNPLYANVLEVTASLFTSFGARAFSSIGGGGDQKYFCFGAIAESSIATILPGYMVLTGSLELQSKSITAGSTRLFYALVYSMLLGYGITVGSQLWATFYPDAPTSATCPRGIDDGWKILLVPTYLMVQALLLRSRLHQIPIQVLIGSAAYAVNYFVSQYTTAQIADTASALMLGILGHVWARSQRAFAFAAVVAGIMVLVPGGLAAQGGLISGITKPMAASSTDAQTLYDQNIYRSLTVGTQMMQVAVGLAVGIFLSALVVYPFGRKNNALVSF